MRGLPTCLKIAWTTKARCESNPLAQSGTRAQFLIRSARGQWAELAGSLRGGVARGRPAARESVRRPCGADAGGGGRARGAGTGRPTRGRRCPLPTGVYLRQPQSRHDELCAPAISQERCAVQRECRGHRILRSALAVGQRIPAGRHGRRRPQYLTTPFVVSSHFKREPDDSKWNPRRALPIRRSAPFTSGFVPETRMSN